MTRWDQSSTGGEVTKVLHSIELWMLSVEYKYKLPSYQEKLVEYKYKLPSYQEKLVFKTG